MATKSAKTETTSKIETEKTNKDNSTLPAKNKSQIEETVADDALVNRAYETLTVIIGKHFSLAMEEVGEYLIKEFYGGKYKLVHDGKPKKKESLNRLIEKLQQADDGAPSKTWIYNSINLVADKRHFEEIEFVEYKNLGLSHKVYLTHVSNLDEKKKLIIETIKNKYTVEQLKKRIAALKKEKPRLIDFLNMPEKTTLLSLSIGKLEKAEKRASDELKELQNRVEKIEEAHNTLKSIVEEKKEQIAQKEKEKEEKEKQREAKKKESEEKKKENEEKKKEKKK